MLYTKRIGDLTPGEQEACMKCNRGNQGSMRATFKYELKVHPKDSRAVMCWADDTLVGWCLIFPTAVWREGKQQKKVIVHTYVRAEYRRQGIGTALLSHARRGRTQPLYAVPWDDRSRRLYDPLIASGKLKSLYKR